MVDVVDVVLIQAKEEEEKKHEPELGKTLRYIKLNCIKF